MAQGTVEDICACERSVTGAYLSGRKRSPIPEKRRPGNGGHLEVSVVALGLVNRSSDGVDHHVVGVHAIKDDTDKTIDGPTTGAGVVSRVLFDVVGVSNEHEEVGVGAEGVRLHVFALPSVVAVRIHHHDILVSANLTVVAVENASDIVEVPETAGDSVTNIGAHVLGGRGEDGGLVVNAGILDNLKRGLLVESLLHLEGTHVGLGESHGGKQGQTKNH